MYVSCVISLTVSLWCHMCHFGDSDASLWR